MTAFGRALSQLAQHTRRLSLNLLVQNFAKKYLQKGIGLFSSKGLSQQNRKVFAVGNLCLVVMAINHSDL